MAQAAVSTLAIELRGSSGGSVILWSVQKLHDCILHFKIVKMTSFIIFSIFEVLFLSVQLVFYVEACESGSMFDSLLPDDLNSMYT
jgi:hypothetical protein